MNAYRAVMSALEMRIRLVSGDLTDVIYEVADVSDQNELLDRAVATLAEDSGALRCRHGDRLLVNFGRGVATIEASPRGAVL